LLVLTSSLQQSRQHTGQSSGQSRQLQPARPLRHSTVVLCCVAHFCTCPCSMLEAEQQLCITHDADRQTDDRACAAKHEA
jgi:hypothetical protein